MLMKEMNMIDYREEVGKTGAMIIPIGAFEVWGPHLPVGSDTLVAEEIASRISEKNGWIVGPCLPIGYSESLFFPEGGTVSVRPESLKNYLSDILESLIECGVQKFCFVSPHLGNVPIVTQIATHLRKNHLAKSCLIDWWRIIQPLCTKEQILQYEGKMAHGHASEAGSSTLLYLYPNLVQMERVIRVFPRKDEYADIPQFTLTRELYPEAVVGDGTVGTREKGEQIVNKAIERIVEFLEQWN